MKTRLFRKVVSFVCVVSLILSVFVASFATGVSAATVDITLNNNGTVTTTPLEAGSALADPTSDIEGNQFLGWYTDTTFETKVETVPDSAATLYAKWATTVIDFNNITSADTVNFGYYARTITDGVLSTVFQSAATAYLAIPAYDAAGIADAYKFVAGYDYDVTLVYAKEGIAVNTNAKRYLKLVYGTGNGEGTAVVFGDEIPYAAVDPVEYVTHKVSFTAEFTGVVSITANNIFDNGKFAVDKIIITEKVPFTGIKLNSNGNEVESDLVEGDALPTPTDTDAGTFLGWYTDTTFTTKVETAPAGPATLYAKWSKLVINFSGIVGKDTTNFSGYERAVKDGLLQATFQNSGTSGYFMIPAYDAKGVTEAFKVENGKAYKVTIKYAKMTKNTADNAKRYLRVIYGTVADIQGTEDGVAAVFEDEIPYVAEDPLNFVTQSISFTATKDSTISITAHNIFSDGGFAVDYIIVEETVINDEEDDEIGGGEDEEIGGGEDEEIGGGEDEEIGGEEDDKEPVIGPDDINMLLYAQQKGLNGKQSSTVIFSIDEATGKLVVEPTSDNGLGLGERWVQAITILKGPEFKGVDSVFKLKAGDVYNVSVTYRVISDISTATGVGIGLIRNFESAGGNKKMVIATNHTTNAQPSTTVTTTIVADDYLNEADPNWYIGLVVQGRETQILLENVSVNLVLDKDHNAGVNFDSKGGTPVDSILAKEGQTIKLPKPTREKYELAGWYYLDENNNEVEFTEKTKLPAGITSLFAKWNIAKGYVRLRFYTNTANNYEFIGKPGEKFEMPADPTAKGYEFLGWYSDRAFKTAFKSNTFPKASHDVFAKWNDPPVIVDFENAYEKTSSGSFSNRFIIDPEEHETKTLLYDITQGTNNQASTKARVILYTDTGSIALIEGNTYKVTFKACGTGTSSLSMFTCSETNTWGNYKQQDATITIDATDKWKEYTLEFVAAFADKTTENNNFLAIGVSGNGPTYFDDFKVEGVENKQNLYGTPIRFNVNGGQALGSIAGNPEDEIVLPTPVKPGYKFLGWYVDPELTTKFAQKTFGETSMTLYAKWQIGKFVEDFEEYPNNIKALGIAGGYDIFTPGTAGDKSNLHGGASSLFRDGTKAGTKAFTLHRAEDLALTPGCVYTVTLWVKPTSVQDTAGTINLISMNSFTGIAAPLATTLITTVDKLTVGEWNKLTYTYTCPAESSFIGISTSANNDMYFDDITVSLNGYSGTATGDNSINPILVMAMIVLAAGAVLVTGKKVFSK